MRDIQFTQVPESAKTFRFSDIQRRDNFKYKDQVYLKLYGPVRDDKESGDRYNSLLLTDGTFAWIAHDIHVERVQIQEVKYNIF
jgi:hypothetical protein